MKNTSKILALVLVVMTLIMSLSAITISAANAKVVNVSDLTITTTTDEELVPGTGIYASAGLSIDSNSKSIDGFDFTKRLKLGGTMKIEGGVVKAGIKIVVDAPSKVILYAMSSSSSTDRVLQIATCDGTAFTVLDTADAPGAAIAKCEYEVEAGTYYIGSKSSGINVYYIAIEPIAVCEHNFENGACTLCGAADPNACKHTNTSPATCIEPEKCLDCEEELGSALGHTEGAAPTCDTAQTCTVCGATLADALGHTLTFVNTLPTAEAAGKTIADCSVCNGHFDFGEVNVMTGGTYVLEAEALAGIAQYSLFDGEVKVIDGVFACHLSYKYRTDFYESGKEKTFAEDDYISAYRMNFGGSSEFIMVGDGAEEQPTGGLKNFIQIVTTGETTITIHWGVGGDNREVAIYDMEGNLVAVTEEKGAKNDLVVSENITLPAGAYLIGSASTDGGNWIHKITVEVEAPHTHDFADATCTEPAKCECGETQGEALGHDFAEGVCTRCEAADPDYVPEQPKDEEPKDEEPKDEAPAAPKLNFFQKVLAWFMELIQKLVTFFKK